MLYADISTPIDSIRCKFPCEPLTLYIYFEDMGIEGPLSKVRLTDYETDATRIRIIGDTEVDAHLAKLFSRKNTLYDVNTVATVIENIDDRIREELEKNIVNDAYSSVWELRKGIRHLMYELGSAPETFFFPISGYLYFDEEYRWGENVDTDWLPENEDTIKNDEGALIVSFWHSGNDYFIYDKSEMGAYLASMTADRTTSEEKLQGVSRDT